MRHESIIRREDGKKIKITVTFCSDHHWETYEYKVFVEVCEPRKRTFKSCFVSDSWEFRKIDYKERPAYIKSKQLEHISEDEILQAKKQLWLKLNPELAIDNKSL